MIQPRCLQTCFSSPTHIYKIPAIYFLLAFKPFPKIEKEEFIAVGKFLLDNMTLHSTM